MRVLIIPVKWIVGDISVLCFPWNFNFILVAVLVLAALIPWHTGGWKHWGRHRPLIKRRQP